MARGNFVSAIVNTPIMTLAWPIVFEGETKTDEKTGKKRVVYRADGIIDPNDPHTGIPPEVLRGAGTVEGLRDLAWKAGEAEWGSDDRTWPQLRNRAVRETAEKNPNPQTGKAWEGYEPGKYFISCQSQYQPSIIDITGHTIIDPAELYGGCKVIFAVNAYTYNYRGVGIKFGLVSILKVADGKPFGAARPDPAQIFKQLIKPGATPGGAVAAPTPATPGAAPARRVL